MKYEMTLKDEHGVIVWTYELTSTLPARQTREAIELALVDGLPEQIGVENQEGFE